MTGVPASDAVTVTVTGLTKGNTKGPAAQGRLLAEVTPALAAQIERLLRASSVPAGKLAKIGALLSHGLYALRFAAPATGTVAFTWYRSRKGAPLLLAPASSRSPQPGPRR